MTDHKFRLPKMMERLFTKIYVRYQYDIYSSISHVRGTTKLANILSRLSRINLEKLRSKELEYISDREWDNLVILDGCRHDTYEKVVSKTEKRYSAGSMSQEYIAKNFSQGDWNDTVYITANPFLEPSYFREETGREPEDVFHEVFYTYKTDWDSENNTVMPKSVVRDAETAEKLFPDKRKIIHFMQPHYPFVNSKIKGRGFRQDRSHKEERVWVKAMKGKLNHEKAVQAYEDNLNFVIPYVEDLAKTLRGKTVITADHGNLLGESGLYGHPRGSTAKVLHNVPWDVISED